MKGLQKHYISWKGRAFTSCLFMCWTACLSSLWIGLFCTQTKYFCCPLVQCSVEMDDSVYINNTAELCTTDSWTSFFFLFCPALTCAQNISLQLPGLFYTPGSLIKVTFAFPSLIWFYQMKFSWKCIHAFCFICSWKCTEKKLFNAVWPPLGIPHI